MLSLASLKMPPVGALHAAEIFTRVTTGPGGDAGNSRGAAWGDYDNDGFIDLFVPKSESPQPIICSITFDPELHFRVAESRSVLDCDSPLPLFPLERDEAEIQVLPVVHFTRPRRQRAGAVQDLTDLPAVFVVAKRLTAATSLCTPINRTLALRIARCVPLQPGFDPAQSRSRRARSLRHLGRMHCPARTRLFPVPATSRQIPLN